jgi:hypothetical protein
LKKRFRTVANAHVDAQRYCGLMPADATIAPHRTVSELWKLANEAGVPPTTDMYARR